MRSLSALARFGLLFMGFALISIVSAPDVWNSASTEEVTTSPVSYTHLTLPTIYSV